MAPLAPHGRSHCSKRPVRTVNHHHARACSALNNCKCTISWCHHYWQRPSNGRPWQAICAWARSTQPLERHWCTGYATCVTTCSRVCATSSKLPRMLFELLLQSSSSDLHRPPLLVQATGCTAVRRSSTPCYVQECTLREAHERQPLMCPGTLQAALGGRGTTSCRQTQKCRLDASTLHNSAAGRQAFGPGVVF